MDKLAEKMAELAEKFGPDVVNAVRAATRVEAYSSLAWTLIAFAFALMMFRGGKYLLNKQSEDEVDNEFTHIIGAVLIGLALIPVSIAVWAWIDPWTWAAINNPDLYVVKKILKL